MSIQPKRNERKQSNVEIAPAPIVIGPSNALAVTGHSWRYVREVLAQLPGVRVIRSGGRIVGVVANDVIEAGAPVCAAPLDVPQLIEEPETQPEDVDGVLALIGRRRTA